jgi:nucleoside-diphosphate-sugar epimerase
MESLRSGAAQADGVIHLAFDHSAFGQDFSKFAEVCEKDNRAIEALGAALIGSDRPLLITSGTGMGNAAPGQPATEDHFDPNHPNPRLGG